MGGGAILECTPSKNLPLARFFFTASGVSPDNSQYLASFTHANCFELLIFTSFQTIKNPRKRGCVWFIDSFINQ